jgi:hypothetical protein
MAYIACGITLLPEYISTCRPLLVLLLNTTVLVLVFPHDPIEEEILSVILAKSKKLLSIFEPESPLVVITICVYLLVSNTKSYSCLPLGYV